MIVAPGETKRVPLGLAFEIPVGYVMFVAMRSGIALKTKLRQSNGIGVIDSDYRGEVAMMFDNTEPLRTFIDDSGDECVDTTTYVSEIGGRVVNLDDGTSFPPSYPDGAYLIRKGDRVAQAFIQPLPGVNFVEVAELSETERGDGGFGHTGV